MSKKYAVKYSLRVSGFPDDGNALLLEEYKEQMNPFSQDAPEHTRPVIENDCEGVPMVSYVDILEPRHLADLDAVIGTTFTHSARLFAAWAEVLDCTSARYLFDVQIFEPDSKKTGVLAMELHSDGRKVAIGYHCTEDTADQLIRPDDVTYVTNGRDALQAIMAFHGVLGESTGQVAH